MSPNNILFIKCARALALAALCMLPSLSIAQDSPTVATDEEDGPIELETIYVTASRFDTDAAAIPASISLIDTNTINAKAATSVADLLGDVGVLMRSYTGNPTQSTIDMRGYGESGNLNVLVLVDGRRVNAPDMSGINWLNMPLASVDKIEVLRGSQSALYGNNAGGGVIKITTSIPDTFGGSAIAGYGSWESWVFRAASWTPVTKNIRARAEVGFVESDGYRDNSGYKTSTASAAFEGTHGNLTWTATAGYDDNYFEYPGPLDDEYYKANPRQSSYAPMGADYNGDSQTGYAGGSVNWKNDGVEAHADLNGSRRNLSWDMGSGSSAESTLDTWTLAPRARFELENGFSAIVGADGEYDHLYLERFKELAHTTRTAHATLERVTGGVYANASWTNKEDKPLTIDATTRFQANSLDSGVTDDKNKTPEEKNDKDGTDSAFSLGATWQPTKTIRLWTRGDRFFRYPAIDEVVAYQGYATTIPFNSDLRSERGWGGELGADWAVPHALLKINAFAQDVDGLIAFDYIKSLNVNIAKATRIGLETSVQANFGDWRFGVFHTLVRVKFEDGAYEDKELYLVPRNQVNTFVEWNPGRFSVRVNARYTGNCWQGNDFKNDEDKMPSYFVTDLVARYKIGASWHVYVAVDNLFDRHYATLRYNGGWYPAAERGYRAGVQWQY